MNEIRFSQYMIYDLKKDQVFFKLIKNPTRKPFLSELELEKKTDE